MPQMTLRDVTKKIFDFCRPEESVETQADAAFQVQRNIRYIKKDCRTNLAAVPGKQG